MHHLISWSQYILCSTFILAFYYAFFVLKFYRKELFSGTLIRGSFEASSVEKLPAITTDNTSKQRQAKSDTELSLAVENFLDELKSMLYQLAQQDSEKSEIIDAIQKLTEKYYLLRTSEFQPALLNAIYTEVETIFGIRLTRPELELLLLY